jgi:predicted CoA-binding protein
MSNSKKTLIIGASENTERYANKAFHSLKNHKHEVVMIGNKEGVIDGVSIQKGNPLFNNIDTITLYLNPKNQEAYYNYILSLKPKRIIFNPGTENIELQEKAKKQGIEIQEACTLVLLSIHQY